MKITANILVRNNEDTIVDCLASLGDIDILIGNIGSSDRTLEICREFGGKIVTMPFENDYSKCRNELVEHSSTEWQLWIEPWEKLRYSNIQPGSQNSYKLYLLQRGILVKQTRLWKKYTTFFRQPVYEYLDPEATELIDCVIFGDGVSNHEILTKWKERFPHVKNIDYYLAYDFLAKEKYRDFLCCAERFLFAETGSSVNAILTRYYCAQVEMIVNKNYQKAIQYVMYCLSEEPTLAEFWCLLGDIFFRLKQWQRASAFYDNAIIFGSRRLSSDPYPIDIAKYKDHPEKMLKICRELIKATYQKTTSSSLTTTVT